MTPEDIQTKTDYDSPQGDRLALQNVHESVSWENMKGAGRVRPRNRSEAEPNGRCELHSKSQNPESHKVPLRTTEEMKYRLKDRQSEETAKFSRARTVSC